MLNELAKQYAPQGLKLIGVTLDQDGDLILMRRFIARYKPIFPNYRKTPEEPEDAFNLAVMPGWNESLTARFGIELVPISCGLRQVCLRRKIFSEEVCAQYRRKSHHVFWPQHVLAHHAVRASGANRSLGDDQSLVPGRIEECE